MGAHVDHQHGLVTGFAIDKGVDLWFSVNGSSQRETSHVKGEMWGENHVHLESKTFEGTVDFDIDAPSQVKEHHWGDYARGAKYALRKRFELKRGITGVIQGSLPVGGLSSSAKKNNFSHRTLYIIKGNIAIPHTINIDRGNASKIHRA